MSKDLPISAWDFEVGKDLLPESQILPCLYYEYALESEAIKDRVKQWRKICRDYQQRSEPVPRPFHAMFYSPLAAYSSFPRKHWLDIPVKRRAQLLTDHPLPIDQSVFRADPDSLYVHDTAWGYYGPSEETIEVVRRQKNRWDVIKTESEYLRQTLERAMTRKDPVAYFYRHVEARLNSTWAHYENILVQKLRESLKCWSGELHALKPQDIINSLFQHKFAIKTAMERIVRGKIETIVLTVDWSRTNRDISDSFMNWIHQNGIPYPAQSKAGRKPTPLELLKALGAKRLLTHFRSRPPLQKCDFGGSIRDFVLQERLRSGRGNKLLYNNLAGYLKAEKSAAVWTERLFPPEGGSQIKSKSVANIG